MGLPYTVIRKFSRGFYFRETSHMRSFVKKETLREMARTLCRLLIQVYRALVEFLRHKYVF